MREAEAVLARERALWPESAGGLLSLMWLDVAWRESSLGCGMAWRVYTDELSGGPGPATPHRRRW